MIIQLHFHEHDFQIEKCMPEFSSHACVRHCLMYLYNVNIVRCATQYSSRSIFSPSGEALSVCVLGLADRNTFYFQKTHSKRV